MYFLKKVIKLQTKRENVIEYILEAKYWVEMKIGRRSLYIEKFISILYNFIRKCVNINVTNGN